MKSRDVTQDQLEKLEQIIENIANNDHEFKIEKAKNNVYDSSGDNKLNANVKINNDFVNVSTLIGPVNIKNVYVRSLKRVVIEGKTDDGVRFRLKFIGGEDF